MSESACVRLVGGFRPLTPADAVLMRKAGGGVGGVDWTEGQKGKERGTPLNGLKQKAASNHAVRSSEKI